MPHRAAMRENRIRALHIGTESAIDATRMSREKRIPISARNNLTRSLIELKRNRETYGFKENQRKLLDMLLKKSRKARTLEDLINIHKLTCGLGREKDLGER